MEPAFRMVQIKFLLGAGAAHIEQAAFFFHLFARLAVCRECGFADQRENAFVATGDMHRIELQALRHVDSHERHRTHGIIHLLVGIGQERYILDKRIESRVRMFLVEFADGVHHFIDVRNTFVGGKLIFLAQEILVPRIGDDSFRKNRERSLARCNQVLPALDKVGKALELRGGAPCAVSFGHKHLPEGAFAIPDSRKHGLHRSLAYGTRRRIDYAQVSRIVLLVCKQTQISKNVLDFLAVPESRTAKNHRRNPAIVQRLLYHAGLRIGTVKDCRLRIAFATGGHNAVRNLLRLGAVVLHVAHANRVARFFLGENLLLHFERAHVMRNHGARPLHDVACGAVIAFQLHNGDRRKIAMEVADNLNVRATPAVNALVVVAHHGHVPLLVDKELQEFVLNVVRVLIFIDNHVFKAVGQLFSKARHLLEHEHRIEQEVIEVHGVRFTQALLVFRIVTGAVFLVDKFGTLHGDIRRLQPGFPILVEHRILVARNSAMHALDFGRIAVIAQFFLEDLLQYALLVVVIVNGEVGIVPIRAESLPHEIPLKAHLQKAQAHRVERSHPFKSHPRIQQFLDTLVHFAGGLVGERHRKNPVGFHPMARNQVGNLVSDGTGLSRTGARKNEHRAVNLLRGRGLLRVQFPVQNARINNTRHQKLLIISIARKYKTIPPGHCQAGKKIRLFFRKASSGASVQIWDVP